ncbi:glutathione S-transferase domain-containing protein [Alcanivorax hongdengensis A-11-3]|uniref:Glutathione S-transferase domain-containing protein n=1 Tax=Alcanivorax hongdengensis A-11-3 TaxID=1177179 RepID=L0WG68_9GAMM|nr:glutathione S-transferase family protein [Alcanivorax hongdengensis]EKF75709.1 glutathione S-transferase domain-containing protein [Alcanivorax hongdengensis A-11-3]
MTLTLHQFPISHYCEKVRWALDHKGLDYRIKNHLPGLHLRKISKLAGQSSVPVLVHDGRVVQGSAAIISYLDERFPQHSLTPAEPALRDEALRWEAFCDEQIGPHLRRYCYDTLLHHPDIVIPFFAKGGPLWGSWFLRAVFPKLQGIMRKAMVIREPEVTQSRERVEQALRELDEATRDREYLVGECFTRADLAAASLLAPLFMPPEYGLAWPAQMPEPLQGWVDSQQPRLAWPSGLYRRHR